MTRKSVLVVSSRAYRSLRQSRTLCTPGKPRTRSRTINPAKESGSPWRCAVIRNLGASSNSNRQVLKGATMNRDQTLEAFFGLDENDPRPLDEIMPAAWKLMRGQLAVATKTLSLATAAVRRHRSDTEIELAASEVLKHLRTALRELSISQLLAGAWSKYDGLRKRSGLLDEQTRFETLFTHSVTSTHRPVVELRAAAAPIARFEFDVEIMITFDVVTLAIQRGRIMSARLGKVEAAGSLKYE